MMRPIVVTGASSFVGAHVVRWLRRTNPDQPVIAVVLRTPLALSAHAPTEVVTLDLRDRAVAKTLAEKQPAAIVHLACRVTGPTAPDDTLAFLDTVLEVCREAGAGLVHGSTTQVHWERQNAYARGRAVEEARIEASGVPYVILRPCAPYGPKLPDHAPAHVESFQRLADAVRRWPAVPLPAGGVALRQPVHLDDWCEVVAHFARGGTLPRRTFDVGGPVPLSLARLVDLLALAMGRRVPIVPVPLLALRAASMGVPGLSPDLLSTMTCDDIVDPGPISAAVGKTRWIRFEEGRWDLLGPEWRRWAAHR